MKKIRLLVIGIFSFLASSVSYGQEKVALTLDDAIARARVQSVDAAVVLNELKTSYWQYRSFRANLLPEVSFNATAPGYYKRYSAYMNDEGKYSFVRNNYMDITGGISMSQSIWFTGGTLSLNTSLDFMRQLEGTKYNRFMSIPVALTLNQPIFGVNYVKWNRKIEPVRYAEAKAQFLSATEQVAMTAINYYFNVLIAKEQVDISRQNLDNASRLYEVAKEKREMGQISQNDLLQMELNVLDAKSSLTSRESSLKNYMFQLRSFLNYDDGVELLTEIPQSVPEVNITYDDALDKAHTNNKFAMNIRRRQLEADYSVAIAKGNLRQITLYAQVGYTGTAGEFGEAYRGLKDNQIVEVGVRVPLLDWGKRRGNVKVAESNREVVKSRLRQETMNFDQNLFILIERFSNQQMQLDIADKADQIARKRYDTNVETYMIGKISTLDLNDSQVKKDQSRINYVNELYQYWYYFYQIRSITLWDFAKNTGIDADFDKIVRR